MSEPLGTVRASSWPTLFDCALRFYYTDILRLRKPKGPSALIGTAIHRGTAAFDVARVEGREPSLEQACDTAADAIAKPADDIDWQDMDANTATSISVSLTTLYARTFAPWQTYKAVEVHCEKLDIATDSGVIRIQGTSDRIRATDDNTLGVVDFKSGKTAVGVDGVAATRGHHLQTGIYRLLAEHALEQELTAPDQIVGFQTGKTEKGQRVGSAEIKDSRTPLVGDEDSPGLIEIAASMLKTGVFPPNPRSILCAEKYCVGWSRCKFHD